ncbi:histidine kinase [Actinokineospora sp. HBU206404]|uniref:Histidine kinase n=2 Tax=Actinokineospora xionganensis TaxID=2684470 RepID=A0ABR7L447_9PSEU|nr:histidine kinase [Actinokineospora xionganensis]
MPGLGIRGAKPWEIPATAVVAVGAWWASLTTLPLGLGWAMLPASILAAVAACHTGATRWAVTVLGSALIGLSGLGAAKLAGTTPDDPVPWTLVISAFSVVFVLSNLIQVWLWSVIRQLDDARALAADLAVAEERLRFAAELHDVQGHHLQAIALKGELAERLIGHDDDAARTQAAAVSELARQALRETRGVVHGYRRTSLSTEIGNAVDILRAAGIAAAVDGDATLVPPALQPLFGALVREGTTNILRHTTAGVCDLVVSVADGRARVRLSNDGVRPRTGDPGSGIDSLRERFAAIGGQLRTEDTGSRFALVGEAAVG